MRHVLRLRAVQALASCTGQLQQQPETQKMGEEVRHQANMQSIFSTNLIGLGCLGAAAYALLRDSWDSVFSFCYAHGLRTLCSTHTYSNNTPWICSGQTGVSNE
jgi:hypothetical protein